MPELVPNEEFLVEYENSKVTKKYIKEKIRELKKSKTFIVGVTANPQETLQRLYEETKMKTMYLLCKTKTKTQAESIEKDLIKVFGKQKNNYYMKKEDKEQTGGADELAKKDNYVYLLLK